MNFAKRLRGRKMCERKIILLGLGIDQNRVALVESAALGILPREAHRIAFKNQRTVGEQFRKAIIDRAFASAHFPTLLQQLDDFGMDVESRWRANQPIGDFRKFFAFQTGVDFKRRSIFPEMIRRPIVWQLAKIRSLSE